MMRPHIFSSRCVHRTQRSSSYCEKTCTGNRTLKRQVLEHTVHSCRLLGTKGILKDAGHTPAYDFRWQRSTEAGHRDTVCIDAAEMDMRAVGPRTNRLRGADPCKGVCVDQRREHGSTFAPRCTEMALIQASTLNQSVAAWLRVLFAKRGVEQYGWCFLQKMFCPERRRKHCQR